jgi:protein gp37
VGDRTGIEWTESTWNPIRGCSRVSEGCRHCYAETVAARFSGPGQAYEGLARRTTSGEARWTGIARLVPKVLDQPIRWDRPRKVFVNSMSDLFHESLTNEEIAAVFGVMAAAPHHTFQVLTKRPQRMTEWFEWFRQETYDTHRKYVLAPYVANELGDGSDEDQRRQHSRILSIYEVQGGHAQRDIPWPLPHVWVGVSVENQAAADTRIPLLLQTPAAVRFLSCEPLLGAVDVSRWLGAGLTTRDGSERLHRDDPRTPHTGGVWDFGLDWVIAGGESGPGARPMHPGWVRGLRDQCAAADVALFFKQMGEWADVTDDPSRGAAHDRIILPSGEVIGGGYKEKGGVDPDWQERGAAWMSKVGKKKAGSRLDAVEHKAFPRGRNV